MKKIRTRLAPGMRIVSVTDLRAGDVISISGKEKDAERVLAIQRRSGYPQDEGIQLLTSKGWTPVGRDSQVCVLRRAAE